MKEGIITVTEEDCMHSSMLYEERLKTNLHLLFELDRPLVPNR